MGRKIKEVMINGKTIKNYKKMKPKVDAEAVVYLVNPHGIIHEVSKSHAIKRIKQGPHFRLATLEERDNYIAMRDRMNEARQEETDNLPAI